MCPTFVDMPIQISINFHLSIYLSKPPFFNHHDTALKDQLITTYSIKYLDNSIFNDRVIAKKKISFKILSQTSFVARINLLTKRFDLMAFI